MALSDLREFHLDDHILPVNGRYWACSTCPSCLNVWFGEIDEPEYGHL